MREHETSSLAETSRPDVRREVMLPDYLELVREIDENNAEKAGEAIFAVFEQLNTAIDSCDISKSTKKRLKLVVRMASGMVKNILGKEAIPGAESKHKEADSSSDDWGIKNLKSASSQGLEALKDLLLNKRSTKPKNRGITNRVPSAQKDTVKSQPDSAGEKSEAPARVVKPDLNSVSGDEAMPDIIVGSGKDKDDARAALEASWENKRKRERAKVIREEREAKLRELRTKVRKTPAPVKEIVVDLDDDPFEDEVAWREMENKLIQVLEGLRV